MTAVPDNRMPSLDGLRAVSILMVLIGHTVHSGSAPAWFAPVAEILRPQLGVRVFFVISGFLITTLLLREFANYSRVNLPNFYIRRVLRLAPVHLVFVGVLFVLTQTTALQMTGCQFLTALTYTKNYACASWIDGHLWSLSVEEQFYLLWPAAIALAPRRFIVPLAIAAIAIAPISRAVEYQMGSRLLAWLTSNSDSLAFGCLAAIYAERLAKLATWRPVLGRTIALALILFPSVLLMTKSMGWFTITLAPAIQAAAIAYLVVSLQVVRRGASFWLLNLPAVAFLGTLSYSLYVWQQIFLSKPEVFGLQSHWALTYPVSLGLCFLAALASYYLIERPIGGLRAAFSPGVRKDTAIGASKPAMD